MRLLDALKILQKADATLPPFRIFLACGFTPLHLQTFLTAAVQERFTGKHIEMSIGVYDDLAGNIGRMADAIPSAGVVVLEWQDLDPRLGIRRVAGWDWQDLPEIAADVRRMLIRLERLLMGAAERVRIIVCFPTLPFPLLSSQHPATVSPLQADLELALAEMKSRLLKCQSIYVLKHEIRSTQVFDPANEILFGFPYSLSHASDLGEDIAQVLSMPPNRKGIITDLDLTAWNGILGDDGVDGVHWDLEHHAQPYGLYQQLLHALAKEGVLVAVASKNSHEIVQQIFMQRQDLILKENDIFPMTASWQPKSEMVEKILKTWNIGPESVIFIDDNPFELEEVGRKYPQMECIQFDPSPRFAMGLWRELRTKFARRTVSEEDRIRSTSIRAMTEKELSPDSNTDIEDFLAHLDAELKFELSRNSDDGRAFELINKTNQFNLNGVRLTDAEFRAYLAQEQSFLLTASYSDKFGALGKISSLLGRITGDEILVEFWVLSCRAFSHRIEFACLRGLFEFFDEKYLHLRWKSTGRNNHLLEFLPLLPGKTTDGILVLDRETFIQECPNLPHKITFHAAKGLEIHA